MRFTSNREEQRIKDSVSNTINNDSVRKNGEDIRISDHLRDVRASIARASLETLQNSTKADQRERLARRIDQQKPGYVPRELMALFRDKIIENLLIAIR